MERGKLQDALLSELGKEIMDPELAELLNEGEAEVREVLGDDASMLDVACGAGGAMLGSYLGIPKQWGMLLGVTACEGAGWLYQEYWECSWADSYLQRRNENIQLVLLTGWGSHDEPTGQLERRNLLNDWAVFIISNPNTNFAQWSEYCGDLEPQMFPQWARDWRAARQADGTWPMPKNWGPKGGYKVDMGRKLDPAFVGWQPPDETCAAALRNNVDVPGCEGGKYVGVQAKGSLPTLGAAAYIIYHVLR